MTGSGYSTSVHNSSKKDDLSNIYLIQDFLHKAVQKKKVKSHNVVANNQEKRQKTANGVAFILLLSSLSVPLMIALYSALNLSTKYWHLKE